MSKNRLNSKFTHIHSHNEFGKQKKKKKEKQWKEEKKAKLDIYKTKQRTNSNAAKHELPFLL